MHHAERDNMIANPTASGARANLVGQPDVTVIIVSYNTANLLDRLFAALEAARGGLRLQLIFVDNASRDNSVDVIRARYPDSELLTNATNVGFGRANNQAVPFIRGRYVLLLNTDAFMAPDALSKTVAYLEANPRCGIVGVKLVGEDGALQPSCRYFPTPWNVFLASTGLRRWFPGTRLVDDMAWDHNSVRECDWVPGCFYLVRREIIDRIGLFDPRYFLYCEEVDHCRAVREAGWSVVYYPFTQVIHIGGESAQGEGPVNPQGRQISALQIESELLYFRKHYGIRGVLASLLLAMVGDILKAGSGMVRHRDIVRAEAAMRHSRVALKCLISTGLASHATR
jgi:GT2 family glycosyltransferase